MAVIAAVFAAAFFVSGASAEIQKADLQRRVVVTEEGALLSQADTLSLYLSSDRIALAPSLAGGGVIEVEATVLGPDLCADADKLKGYVVRICETFVSVLKDRLPIYTPALAKKFDASKDVVFIVNSGSQRAPVGTLKGCAWEDAVPPVAGVAVVEAPPSELNETRAIEAEETKSFNKLSCGCPVKR